MPKKLYAHSSVTRGSNLIVIGGYGDKHYSPNLYKLTFIDKQFKWSEMDVQLKTPRRYFVASLIPV